MPGPHAGSWGEGLVRRGNREEAEEKQMAAALATLTTSQGATKASGAA